MEDWLDDPLMIFNNEKGRLIYRKPNTNLLPELSWDLWCSFHFATRLKLEGSVYFCSQLLGPGSLPDDWGLHLLTHRLGMWYSHAFFFELCSAYDTLLQEINVIYNCGFAVDKVNWRKIKPKLSKELYDTMARRRNEDWFQEILGFRNTATHHYAVPMEKQVSGVGQQVWGQEVDKLRLVYIDQRTLKVERKDVAVCKDYLKMTLNHIHEVWGKMADKFA